MNARRGMFEHVSTCAILLAVAACGLAAFAGLTGSAPLLSGVAHIESRGATVRVVRDGAALSGTPDELALGDKVLVLRGRPIMRVPGGSVELEPGAHLEVQVPLRIDRADATARGQGLNLDLSGVTAVVDGVVRIERGYSTQISVLSGRAVVASRGRTLALPALHEAVVPGPGLLPTVARPIGSSSAEFAAVVDEGSALTALAPLDDPPANPPATPAVPGAMAGEDPPIGPEAVPPGDPTVPPTDPLPVVPTLLDELGGLLRGLLGP